MPTVKNHNILTLDHLGWPLYLLCLPESLVRGFIDYYHFHFLYEAAAD